MMTYQELMAALEAPHDGKQRDIFVGGVAGLSLRQGAKGASWVLRGRVQGNTAVKTWTLATMDSLNLREARERGAAALQMARMGQDPKDWLSSLPGAFQRIHKAISEPAFEYPSYKDAVQAFLDDKAATTVQATYRSYKSDLMHGEILANVQNLNNLTVDQLQIILNSMVKRGKRVQAINTRRNMLTFLRWCLPRREMGVTRDWIADLETGTSVSQPSIKIANENRDNKLPTIKDLEGFVWSLEGASASIHMKLGLLFVALTGWRIKTLREAHASWLVGDILDIPGRAMKSGRRLLLPLGPYGLSVYQEMVRLAPKNDEGMIFPGRVKGQVMTYAPFNELCHAGLGRSIHPLRHAFATYGETRVGSERLVLQSILDHAERSIFEQSYVHEKRMDMMRAALTRWEDWFLTISQRVQDLPSFMPKKQ